ncbi:MAG: hypothetical protein ACI837_000126 [Crocinitomicaceae bacterium]|jgi:hypothetical protein
MKIKRCFLLIALMFLGISASNAQLESVIPNFSASEFNGKVLLNWAITQGNTCNGIEILHSTDSINFVKIGSIEGICGGSEEIYHYEHTDNNPEKNITNYYRLQLGGVGYSWIISLHIIDPGENNYRIGPNPLNETSLLHLTNDNHALLTLNVYNLSGVHLKELTTTSPVFELSKNDFGTGKYLFLVTREFTDSIIEGSFIVN